MNILEEQRVSSRVDFSLPEKPDCRTHSVPFAMTKVAFTLAEVLITLGIIGVVAAITMPALIAKYQKKVFANRAKQAYSILAQAIKLSEVQNGEAKDWVLGNNTALENTERFLNQYILPYLNSPKLCGIGGGEAVLKKCGMPVSANGISYFLTNGSTVSIVVHQISTTIGAISFMIVDVNGKAGPNIQGKDAFYFVLTTENGLVPYGAWTQPTREQVLDGINFTVNPGRPELISCKKSKNEENEDELYRHGCTLLLMMDGWEIKDDYPW